MSTAPALRTAAAEARPVLFDGEAVRVVDARAFGSRACVVTFSSWTDDTSLDRPGFGEAFLQGEGVDALHVISRGNQWWQHEETLPAMAAVRAAVGGRARVVTYGSSMGAYAAARLGEAAGAHAALALSPQFSILPAVAPFEHRWGPTSRTLRPVWELTLPTPRTGETYLVHDPADLDARHVELFARSGQPFTPVRLRHAGHQTATFLAETGLLKAVVREVLAGPLDAPALEREAWRRRRRSPQHVLTLAEHAQDPELRLALTRRALRIIPESPVLLSRLGEALAQAGRIQAAAAAQAAALAQAPDWPPVIIAEARARAAAGDMAGAVASLTALAARTGDPAHAWAAADLGPAARSDRRGLRRVRRRDVGPRAAADAPPVEVAADEAGCVLCGPHIVLRPGRYAVSFGVEAAGPRRPLRDLLPVAAVDVALSTGPRLARRTLSTRELRRGRVTLEFVLPERAACEFRVFAHGRAALRVDPARPCRRLGPA